MLRHVLIRAHAVVGGLYGLIEEDSGIVFVSAECAEVQGDVEVDRHRREGIIFAQARIV